jgi:NAD(P)-dependent dehydrogenase (short-subunit alcohol dehydrogenase family)
MNNQLFENLFDLKGKVGIVTGGSSGVGFSAARALGHAGVKEAVVTRTEAKRREAAAKLSNEGANARAYPADVSNEQEAEAMVRSVAEDLGPIDILVSGAAVYITGQTIYVDGGWKVC